MKISRIIIQSTLRAPLYLYRDDTPWLRGILLNTLWELTSASKSKINFKS